METGALKYLLVLGFWNPKWGHDSRQDEPTYVHDRYPCVHKYVCCMHMNACTSMGAYIHIRTYVYVCIHTYVHTYIHVCHCIWMHACPYGHTSTLTVFELLCLALAVLSIESIGVHWLTTTPLVCSSPVSLTSPGCSSPAPTCGLDTVVGVGT